MKGHNGDEGNEVADELVNDGANKADIDHLDLEVDPKFNLSRAKLASMTQATAYQGICERNDTIQRTMTLENIEQIKDAIQEATGKRPKESRI